MPSQDDTFARHQQSRWMREDAARWIRPDVARFLPPRGKRKMRDAPARTLSPDHAREIKIARYELSWLRFQAALLRCAIARKFNPDQPRVPAGNPGGGQWTDADGDLDGVDTYTYRDHDLNVDLSDLGTRASLFTVGDEEFIKLAGELPDLPSPDGPPPEIPPTEPPKGPDRTRFLVGLAKWLGRNTNLAGKLLEGSIRATDWLNDKRDLIEAAKEPPRPLDVLQDLSRFEKPGYGRHHVVEKTSAQYWGFAKETPNVRTISSSFHVLSTGRSRGGL